MQTRKGDRGQSERPRFWTATATATTAAPSLEAARMMKVCHRRCVSYLPAVVVAVAVGCAVLCRAVLCGAVCLRVELCGSYHCVAWAPADNVNATAIYNSSTSVGSFLLPSATPTPTCSSRHDSRLTCLVSRRFDDPRIAFCCMPIITEKVYRYAGPSWPVRLAARKTGRRASKLCDSTSVMI